MSRPCPISSLLLLASVMSPSAGAVLPWAATCERSERASPSGLAVQIQEDCSVLVGDARSLDTRAYLFTADAELRVILGSDTLFTGPLAQGSRSFYLFPATFTKPKFLSDERGFVTILTPSGLRAVFSHATRQLVSLTGYDLTVLPGLEAARSEHGGVKLIPQAGHILLDTGWTLGSFVVDPNRDYLLVEWRDSGGHTCRSIFFELFTRAADESPVFRFPREDHLRDQIWDTCPNIDW